MRSASVFIGSGLTALHKAGLSGLSAALANVAFRGRRFSIDHEGDWINHQPQAAFASPNPHMVRADYVAEVMRDEWLYAYTPKPTDVVFDVGAGIGEEAVALSPLVKRIYAIEAHPRTFRCLKKTLTLSDRTNVTPIHCALADRDGTLIIGDGEHHLSNSVVTRAANGVTVPARSLESVCAELGITEIDHLKMNIEGAERLAVQGFGKVRIRNLAISCHDFIPGESYQTRAEVVRFLRAQGYRVSGRRDHPRPWTREMVFATSE